MIKIKVKWQLKDVNDLLNKLNLDLYKRSLYNNEEIKGTNRGFRLKDNAIETYEQSKIILTNKYNKRVVIDTIYTRPYMPNEISGKNDKPGYSNIVKQNKTLKHKIQSKIDITNMTSSSKSESSHVQSDIYQHR